LSRAALPGTRIQGEAKEKPGKRAGLLHRGACRRDGPLCVPGWPRGASLGPAPSRAFCCSPSVSIPRPVLAAWRSPACCVPDAVWQTQWANQRLQKVLGQDVSEVCEYLVNIEVCCVRWFAPCPHWSASAPPLPRGPRARLSRLPAHHPVWCVGQPHLPAALAPRPMRARRDEAHDAAHDAQTGRRRAARVR
jgi:hypothetical protein